MIELGLFDPNDVEELFKVFLDWDRGYTFHYDVFLRSLKEMDHKTTKILTAKENDSIVGYAQMTKCKNLGFEEYYEVVQLLVSEAHRGSGVGKAIMDEVERIAISENIRIIKLSSRIQRSKAHVFYESLGYEMIKVSKFYQKEV
ncbi:MAG: GNAT family N-acetyltransferase [Treponemataceae bacterium]